MKARILTKGMRGNDVRMAMLTLKDRGYYSGIITKNDKLFGNSMEKAVLKFRADKKLINPSLAIVDEAMWNLLLAE